MRNLQNKINSELEAARTRRERLTQTNLTSLVLTLVFSISSRTEEELKDLEKMAKARIKEYDSSGKVSR